MDEQVGKEREFGMKWIESIRNMNGFKYLYCIDFTTFEFFLIIRVFIFYSINNHSNIRLVKRITM